MEINQKQLDDIRDSYQLSLMYIEDNQFELATKQLYHVLDPINYDLSLDIMYNYNKEFKYEELRQLILKVDDALINYSGETEI